MKRGNLLLSFIYRLALLFDRPHRQRFHHVWTKECWDFRLSGWNCSVDELDYQHILFKQGDFRQRVDLKFFWCELILFRELSWGMVPTFCQYLVTPQYHINFASL
jgi:hypothetical protein